MPTPTEHHLPIHEPEETVECPRKGTISIDDCFTCPRCTRLRFISTGVGSTVTCVIPARNV